jgi:hypothetical protein
MSERTAEELLKLREMNDEDFNALMASDIWLYQQDLVPYDRKWVAVLGEKIIDSDANQEELYRRVNALGGTIDRDKVLIRYIPGFDEIYE